MSSTASPADPRYACLLFTTNKEPRIAFDNRPPGTNTTGIYTAITGYYPIVSNGVNYGYAASNSYPDFTIHQIQPRTAIGVSQDNRYLFIMTIDGRQNGYSDGAYDTDTAYWMMQFGAWNAINMDGGGSTALYSSDSTGNPVPLNHSSYVVAYGRERYIGSHFGVYAKPLTGFINDVEAQPGDTTATITWTTLQPGTSQVEYGLTTALGTPTPLQSALVTNHSALLTGLTPFTDYYFSVRSQANGTTYISSNFHFVTTNYVATNVVFDLTNVWRFTTANLDGTSWTDTAYDDSGWEGSGPGLLWVDTRGVPNANIPVPMLTEMPPNPTSGNPYSTYYFRTHFTAAGPTSGAYLLMTNYIDDGAVFYLNGVEICRVRMPSSPTVIVNSTLASGYACLGDATCPDELFFGVTNLVAGDNVMSVEMHNYNPASPDITLGVSLALVQPTAVAAQLGIELSNDVVTVSWNQSGFTLQEAPAALGPWTDVPGPVVSSPFTTSTSSAASRFFRLRR